MVPCTNYNYTARMQTSSPLFEEERTVVSPWESWIDWLASCRSESKCISLTTVRGRSNKVSAPVSTPWIMSSEPLPQCTPTQHVPPD